MRLRIKFEIDSKVLNVAKFFKFSVKLSKSIWMESGDLTIRYYYRILVISRQNIVGDFIPTK